MNKLEKVLGYSEIAEGARIPMWYGLAYRLPDRYCDVFYPIPLNLIVAIARKVYARLVIGFKSDALIKAYRVGFEDGIRHWKDVVARDAYRKFMEMAEELESFDNQG